MKKGRWGGQWREKATHRKKYRGARQKKGEGKGVGESGRQEQ